MPKLTTAKVDNIKPSATRQEVADALVAGLFLIVQPSGAKSWQVRYRTPGARRRMALGRYPVLGLADARIKARDVLADVAAGGDPAAERKAAKAERIEARLSDRDKVQTLVEQFDRRHLSRLRSGRTVRRELDRHAVAVWGNRDVRDIRKRDVIDLLDAIVDSGREITANRVRAYLGKFFAWCVERDVIEASPMVGVKAPAPETSRDRVLGDDELRWLWRACEALGQPWGPLGQMLLLTGQRLGEVAGMTDGELAGDDWLLPASRVKNGRPHVVPLSGRARDVLDGIERIGAGGLIHTTTGRTPLSGFAKGRDHIAAKMQEIADRERGGPVLIPRWTFHDLRRTAATGMARLGIPVRVTEAVLNHVSGTGGGIVAVYQRHDYADEKRAALEAWSRFIGDLVEGKSQNVVALGLAR
jgi:integrase